VPAPETVPTESPGITDEKETTMIKRHSDVVLETTAHDQDTSKWTGTTP
jgi:hypothetical protein